jgi:hypothetical protein
MSRFQLRTELFVKTYLTSTKYTLSIREDMSFGGDDPSSRIFRVTFSIPDKSKPVPSASAYVLVRLKFSGKSYDVEGYSVEGRKQIYKEDFKFNERWIDEVIERKGRIRDVLGIAADEFVESRLATEDAEGERRVAEKGAAVS